MGDNSHGFLRLVEEAAFETDPGSGWVQVYPTSSELVVPDAGHEVLEREIPQDTGGGTVESIIGRKSGTIGFSTDLYGAGVEYESAVDTPTAGPLQDLFEAALGTLTTPAANSTGDIAERVAASSSGTTVTSLADPDDFVGLTAGLPYAVLNPGASSALDVRWVLSRTDGTPDTMEINRAHSTALITDVLSIGAAFNSASDIRPKTVVATGHPSLAGSYEQDERSLSILGVGLIAKLSQLAVGQLARVEWSGRISDWAAQTAQGYTYAQPSYTPLRVLGQEVAFGDGATVAYGVQTVFSIDDIDLAIELAEYPSIGGTNGRAGWVHTKRSGSAKVTVPYSADWRTIQGTAGAECQFDFTLSASAATAANIVCFYAPHAQLTEVSDTSVGGVEAQQLTFVFRRPDAAARVDVPAWNLGFIGKTTAA